MFTYLPGPREFARRWFGGNFEYGAKFQRQPPVAPFYGLNRRGTSCAVEKVRNDPESPYGR